ncbi:hypothetical protein OTU49_008762 [Cherax quadricarinatus]|uniref:Uncharacterized protein n=2 Tax=Cherax quadricarinatus TaxID=27406 RepID=A0AAW0WE80_CHEQU
MSQKDTEQDFSRIVENVIVPVLPSPSAKPTDILTVPEDSKMHIETNDNDYSPKMKDYGLVSQEISKSLEEECLTYRKTAENKRLGLQKQVDSGTQTQLNGHVAQDVHRKHPSHPVDDSESGEELHLHSIVESTSVSVGHRGSLRSFLKVWDTFSNSKLQSMQMESFQTSQQSNKTQKNVSSFWSIDSDEMHSDQETDASQNSALLRKKSRYGEAQHISLSSCQKSGTRLINTSSVPDYSILGGDRWVSAVKKINANKKPILHLASHAHIVKKTNKNKNRYGRKMS